MASDFVSNTILRGCTLTEQQLDERTAQTVLERHRQLRCYTINTVPLAKKLVSHGSTDGDDGRA